MFNLNFNQRNNAAVVALPLQLQHMTFMSDSSHSDSNSGDSNRIYKNGKPGWFWPLLLLLLVIGWLWYYLRCCSNLYEGGRGGAVAMQHDADSANRHGDDANMSNEHSTNGASTEAAGALDANGNYIINTGANTELTLPDGTKMTVGQNSTENKLYKLLNSTDALPAATSKDAWITLDRVYFESGGSNLTAESQTQLKNIAAILKNYPTAIVKMGGYTDNTGALEVNKKISGERAGVAAKFLTNLGVAANNVSSEGFGPEFPICEANDTPECRAQNRRVDIRVKSR